MQVIPVDKNAVSERVRELFGIKTIHSFEPAEGGYLCRNFVLQTDRGKFFLKEYRTRMSPWVYEIKYAERFFHSHGIPVILPMKDRHDRGSFWVDGNWHSLFPYIDGKVPKAHELNETAISSLGDTLGQLHQIGRHVKNRPFVTLTLWDYDCFMMQNVEIEYGLAKNDDGSELWKQLKMISRLKYDLVQKNRFPAHELPLAKDHLLHGDFIYQNVFFDEEDQVQNVFDFEKTCIGPRAYELSRSLLINCFDDGWEEVNYNRAKAFVKAYKKRYPISLSEVQQGMWMYFLDLIHSHSMEARLALYKQNKYMDHFNSHAMRIMQMKDMDIDAFCEKIYRG